MKAAVITLHSVCNYGTQLQAYATQEKLKQYFEDVSFINYKRRDTYGKELIKTFTKGNIFKLPIIMPTIINWKYTFENFQKKYLNISSKEYLKIEDFKNFEDIADVYFSGSDQVWNTGWNNGIIPPFYLSFVPENKQRYAYASSFGKKKLSEEEIKETEQYLKKYDKISVREESGVDILNKQLNINNVTRIVDPTLAMEPQFWRNIAPKSKIKGDYILIYNLNRNKKFDEYAKKLSKKTGLKLYRFCTRYDQIFRCGKSILIPEILDLITLIDNAKIVLTDSFHATAFSMNLNTEPICIYPDNYSGRLSEFLKLVNSEQRHAKDYDDFEVVDRHVDFEQVNKILDDERKKVDYFLEEIILNNGGNKKSERK